MDTLSFTRIDERKQKVLKATVEEFISTGVPVASSLLAGKQLLGWSPATIRNDLAELDEMGYLMQPHVSSGRIPTDSGYRAFVDFLMPDATVSKDLVMHVQRELTKVASDSEEVAVSAAKVLSEITEGIALATLPIDQSVCVRKIDVVYISPKCAVLVVVLDSGEVIHQQTWFSYEHTRDELRNIVERINSLLYGKNYDEMMTILNKNEVLLMDSEQYIIEKVAEIMMRRQTKIGEFVAVEGIGNLLKHPEFKDAYKVQPVLGVIEEPEVLLALVKPNEINEGFVQVIIGRESQMEELECCSLFITWYGPSNRRSGMFCIVGPKRVSYADTVVRMKLVAHTTSKKLDGELTQGEADYE